MLGGAGVRLGLAVGGRRVTGAAPTTAGAPAAAAAGAGHVEFRQARRIAGIVGRRRVPRPGGVAGASESAGARRSTSSSWASGSASEVRKSSGASGRLATRAGSAPATPNRVSSMSSKSACAVGAASSHSPADITVADIRARTALPRPDPPRRGLLIRDVLPDFCAPAMLRRAWKNVAVSRPVRRPLKPLRRQCSNSVHFPSSGWSSRAQNRPFPLVQRAIETPITTRRRCARGTPFAFSDSRCRGCDPVVAERRLAASKSHGDQ